MKSSPCALAAVLATLGVCAWAQVGDTISPAAPRTAARPATFAAASVPPARMTADAREERRFLRDAAAQTRFELEASRLAFSKSGNSAVRSLAASLTDHHNTVGLELAHLLNSRGMALPMTSNEQRRALNRLAKLTGTRFDAVYMQQVGLAQAAAVRDYEKASLAIREPQINAWIVRTLPTMRSHLTMAERLVPGDPQTAGAVGVQPMATTPGIRLNASNNP